MAAKRNRRLGLCAAVLLLSACAPVRTAAPLAAADDWPLWAYGITAPPKPGDTAKPQPAPGPWFDPAIPREEQLKPIHIEGSTVSYTLVELNDGQHAPDWFPDSHGPVPSAILHGPAGLGKLTLACGDCHRVQGGGRPENAPVYGLPVAYFLRQIEDFRAGRRHSADPRKPNVPTMIELAKALSDDEARAVAEFWASQDGGPTLQVIESALAPPTRLHGNLFVKTSDALTEPLGDRIIEVPADFERMSRTDDPRVGYVAYVPPGSLARGRALAETGRFACGSCHGPGLRGLGDAPPLAGRSPSYLVRQLHGFRSGARDGTRAALMKPVAANLSARDMMELAAYIASLPRSIPGADAPP
jgi:cytochrome c553